MSRDELQVMRAVDELLGELDAEARQRVLAWAAAKFSVGPVLGAKSFREDAQHAAEMPGIAVIRNQRLEVVLSDLKAQSGVDAAIRLAHVVLFAYERLTGERSASTRKVLVPILREWRLYDGNTRARLAGCRGIVRKGDLVSLDAPAKRYAQSVIDEILNPDVPGRWHPPVTTRGSNRRARAGA